MIRAFILKLLGGLFEVRLVNQGTGKDIPGRCIAKGGYWKCRKAFNAKVPKLKHDQLLRLQCVMFLAIDWKGPEIVTVAQAELELEPAIPDSSIPKGVIVHTEVPEKIWGDADVDNLNQAVAESPDDFVQVRVEGEFPSALAELQERERDDPMVNQRPIEPDRDDPRQPPPHTCNKQGPMEHHEVLDAYRATCSICGMLQPESEDVGDVADASV